MNSQPNFNNKPKIEKFSTSKLNRLKSTILGGVLAASTLTNGVLSAEKAIGQPMGEGVKIARSMEGELAINMTNIPAKLAIDNPNAFNVHTTIVDRNGSRQPELFIGLNKSEVLIQKSNSMFYNGYNMNDYQTHNRSTPEYDQLKQLEVKGNGKWNEYYEEISSLDEALFKSNTLQPGQDTDASKKPGYFLQKEMADGIYGNSKDQLVDRGTLIVGPGKHVNPEFKQVVYRNIHVSTVAQLREFKNVNHSTITIMNPEIKTANDLLKLVGMFPNTNNKFIINAKHVSEADFQTINKATRELFDNALLFQLDRIGGSRQEIDNRPKIVANDDELIKKYEGISPDHRGSGFENMERFEVESLRNAIIDDIGPLEFDFVNDYKKILGTTVAIRSDGSGKNINKYDQFYLYFVDSKDTAAQASMVVKDKSGKILKSIKIMEGKSPNKKRLTFWLKDLKKGNVVEISAETVNKDGSVKQTTTRRFNITEDN
jgi:hypothetical protein